MMARVGGPSNGEDDLVLNTRLGPLHGVFHRTSVVTRCSWCYSERCEGLVKAVLSCLSGICIPAWQG